MLDYHSKIMLFPQRFLQYGEDFDVGDYVLGARKKIHGSLHSNKKKIYLQRNWNLELLKPPEIGTSSRN